MASPKMKPPSHDLHFSHEPPLECTCSPPKPNQSCFGCKGTIFTGNTFYECKNCNFFLHQVCHDLPKDVEHPSDPDHRFTLHLTPASGKEAHDCKACSHHISGFCYSCVECKDYYHILCLMAPLSVKISSHDHNVKLEFSPPYDFECDLCKEPSYSGWLYHCGSCEFDVHIICAIKSKEEEWIEQGSMARDKGQQLMELIAQGVNGSDHLEQQVHPGQLSPSYQFSDASFSIDFDKSLLINEYIAQESKESLKNIDEISSGRNSREPIVKTDKIMAPTSKGIGSDIWSELGRESEKSESTASRNGKDVAKKKKPDLVCLKSSCWFSFQLCLCCGRN